MSMVLWEVREGSRCEVMTSLKSRMVNFNTQQIMETAKGFKQIYVLKDHSIREKNKNLERT